MQTKLTQTVVQNAEPAEKLYWIRDTLVNGFVLSVSYGGKKTFSIDYKKPSGKRATHKIGDATRFTVAEAREVAQQFLAQVEKGEDPDEPVKKVTLGEFFTQTYEPWVLANRRSGDMTAYTIKYNFAFLFDRPLDELTIEELERWRSKKKREGLKDCSVNRRITALKAAINWAVKRSIIQDNPLTKLERLPEEDSDRKIRYLSEDERERLMKALDDREAELRRARDSHIDYLAERGLELVSPIEDGEFADHLKPLVLVSLSTGIRRNSAMSLEWRDVDFPNKNLTVRAATSKSGKAYYVPLNKVAFDALSRWRDQSRRTKPNDLVFPSPQTGKKMDNCNTSWERLLKRANIEHFRWHDMRHDFASQLVMKGADLNTVRELMGHSDMKMTLRYAHLAPESKLQAVKLLD
jgi:integrase